MKITIYGWSTRVIEPDHVMTPSSTTTVDSTDWRWTMPDDSREGLGLAEAIKLIREDLLEARAAGEDADVRFLVESVAVELQVVATRETNGRAGFKVPFVNLELGGSASRQWEHTSTVTVTFGPPVDRDGDPVRIAESSDELKK